MGSYIHWAVGRLLELHVLEPQATISQKVHLATGNGKESVDTLRAKIPLNMLLDHDRQRRHGKRSVAEVRDGVCSGCRSVLPVGGVNTLKSGNLFRCGNWGRYLYLMEEANEPSPGQKSVKLARKTRKQSTATHRAK
jgi:predicted  nucleic acid-binding Zn-ribbon protein